MSGTKRFITGETALGVTRAVWSLTGSTRRRVIVAQQITAVCTGLDVVFADSLTAGVTGDDMGDTV